MELVIIAGWLVLCLIPPGIAEKKGYGRLPAFLISLVFSPLIGFLYVLAIPDRGKKEAAAPPAPAKPLSRPADVAKPKKEKCPHCGGTFVRPGEKCPACGR